MSSTSSARSAPPHLNSLLKRISNSALTRGTVVGRLTAVVCNTVIGQMIPDGVVKGGTAMKLRIGESGSRFTPDFDASRRAGLSIDDYQILLAENLQKGWGGFSGTLVVRVPAEQIPFWMRWWLQFGRQIKNEVSNFTLNNYHGNYSG